MITVVIWYVLLLILDKHIIILIKTLKQFKTYNQQNDIRVCPESVEEGSVSLSLLQSEFGKNDGLKHGIQWGTLC